jgi:hemerythrin
MTPSFPPSPTTGGHALGYPAMDRLHDEFLQLLERLGTAEAAELPGIVDALLEQSREHFGAEDRWMLETAFPARECHANEHAAVLRSMEGVRRRVVQGDVAAARSLATALADWFPAHADYLDSALAHWMCKRRFGGQPVVLRKASRQDKHPEPYLTIAGES